VVGFVFTIVVLDYDESSMLCGMYAFGSSYFELKVLLVGVIYIYLCIDPSWCLKMRSVITCDVEDHSLFKLHVLF